LPFRLSPPELGEQTADILGSDAAGSQKARKT
jgi:hypothetical protein